MKQTLRFGVMVIAFMALVSFSTMAQTGTISGKVLDGDTGEPLIGANILVKGTTQGAVADITGGFKIGNVEAGEKTIIMSFIGFTEQEMSVTVRDGQDTNIGEVKLASSAIGLAEVQVIASVAVDRKTVSPFFELQYTHGEYFCYIS